MDRNPLEGDSRSVRLCDAFDRQAREVDRLQDTSPTSLFFRIVTGSTVAMIRTWSGEGVNAFVCNRPRRRVGPPLGSGGGRGLARDFGLGEGGPTPNRTGAGTFVGDALFRGSRSEMDFDNGWLRSPASSPGVVSVSAWVVGNDHGQENRHRREGRPATRSPGGDGLRRREARWRIAICRVPSVYTGRERGAGNPQAHHHGCQGTELSSPT